MKRKYNNNRGSAAIGIIIAIVVIVAAVLLVSHFMKKGKESDTTDTGYYVSDGVLYSYSNGKSSKVSDVFSEDTDSIRLTADGNYIYYLTGTSLMVSKIDGSSSELVATETEIFEINPEGTEVIYTSGNNICYQAMSEGKTDGEAKVLAENCVDIVSLSGASGKVSAYYISSKTEKIHTADYIVDIPSKPANNAQRTLINDLKTSDIDVTFFSINYVSNDANEIIDDDIVYENVTNAVTFRSASDAAAVVYQRATFKPEVSFNAIRNVRIDDAEGEVKIAFNVATAWYSATETTVKEIGGIDAMAEVTALSDDGKVLCYFDNYSEDVQYQYADLMRLDLVGNNQPTKVCDKVYTESEIKFIAADKPVYLMYADIDQYKLGANSEKRSEEGTLVREDSVVTGGNTVAFITTDGDLYCYTEGGAETKAVKVESSVSKINCVTSEGTVIYTLESGEIKIVDNTGTNPGTIK